jgi:GNAT superfamily N-acetyltransferase
MVMDRNGPLATRFRRLGPTERDQLARLAAAAFDRDRFYETALGLDAHRFQLYWSAFFDLALTDPAATVFGLERGAELVAAVAMAYDGFPRASRGIAYLWTLLRRIGLRALLRYLKFVRAYDRVMQRPAEERRVEACGLWLFVSPSAGSVGLGSRLARRATEAVHADGKLLITGFVNADNLPLLQFYRRNGFTVTPPFPFAGMMAARIERWLEPLQEESSC